MRKYFKEPFPALSHLFGVFLSLAALILLLEKSGSSERAAIASATYGVSLILLYLASTLTHGPVCSSKLSLQFERCDHAAIFFLIAGTYTPVCLLIIKGPIGWALLIVEWLLAFAGAYSVFFRQQSSKAIQVITYLSMGWLFLLAIGPIVSAVPNSLLAWLIGGGLFYSIGSIIFLSNRPTLWQGYFGPHDLWHIFVLGGSTCHYIFIYSYVESLALI